MSTETNELETHAQDMNGRVNRWTQLTINHFRKVYEKMQSDKRQVKAEQEQMRKDAQSEIARIDQDTTKLRQDMNALAIRIDSMREEIKKRNKPGHVLPHPPKLTDCENLPQWLREMLGKLFIDRDAIGENEDQFYYVYSRLDYEAQEEVLDACKRADSSSNWDPQLLLQALIENYSPAGYDREAACWDMLESYFPSGP